MSTSAATAIASLQHLLDGQDGRIQLPQSLRISLTAMRDMLAATTVVRMDNLPGGNFNLPLPPSVPNGTSVRSLSSAYASASSLTHTTIITAKACRFHRYICNGDDPLMSDTDDEMCPMSEESVAAQKNDNLFQTCIN